MKPGSCFAHLEPDEFVARVGWAEAAGVGDEAEHQDQEAGGSGYGGCGGYHDQVRTEAGGWRGPCYMALGAFMAARRIGDWMEAMWGQREIRETME